MQQYEIRGGIISIERFEQGNAHTLLSIETELQHSISFSQYVQENFDAFMQHIKVLSAYHQDLLLLYFVAHRTQSQIAKLFPSSTQTNISQDLRQARNLYGAHLLLPSPTLGQITDILRENHQEELNVASLRMQQWYQVRELDVPHGCKIRHMITISAAEAVFLTLREHIHQAAKVLCVHRPSLFRAMKAVVPHLTLTPESRALAALLWEALQKDSRCKRRNTGDMELRVHKSMGKFSRTFEHTGEIFSPDASELEAV